MPHLIKLYIEDAPEVFREIHRKVLICGIDPWKVKRTEWGKYRSIYIGYRYT